MKLVKPIAIGMFGLLGTVAATSDAFACRGFLSSVVGQCWLDDVHDAMGDPLNKFVPPPPPPPLPAGPFPAPVPGPVMGGACLTMTGLHPMNVIMPVGSTCSGTNQFGLFEVGTVR
jgi:hypothetical protein